MADIEFRYTLSSDSGSFPGIAYLDIYENVSGGTNGSTDRNGNAYQNKASITDGPFDVPWEDGFEDGSVSDWTVNNSSDVSVVTTSPFRGSYALEINGNIGTNPIMEKTIVAGGSQFDAFSWNFFDIDTYNGAQVRLLNSAGNIEVAFGSHDQEWSLTDGNGTDQLVLPRGVLHDDRGYWNNVHLTFDWAAGTYKLHIYEEPGSQDDAQRVLERTLGSGTDIETIQIYPQSGTSNHSTGFVVTHRFDEFRAYNYNSTKDGAIQSKVISGFDGTTNNNVWVDQSTKLAWPDRNLQVQQIEFLASPSPPKNVTASYVSDAQGDLSWDPPGDGTADSYDIEILRDNGTWLAPTGGPSSVTDDGSASYTKSYNPNSDQSYGSQFGVDSPFQFRVRSSSTAGTSDWVTSGTIYTTPVSPHNASVSRPGGNDITISWTNQSNSQNGTEVQYREDAGSGYGAWSTIETTASTATSVSYDTSTDTWFQTDARYNFRVRHVRGTKTSPWVYADYGNKNNLYFSDDFEDQDLTEWTTSLADTESGIQSTSYSDLGISGADQGTYYVRLDAGDYIQKSLGDLSGESNVIVKAAVATGSMDTSTENTKIRWYDGTAWQTLRSFYWEYNAQGWIEITALVPSSYLSTDNRVRFIGYGGGGDHFAVDRVVVSDILHEYTTPAGPTGFSVDISTPNEGTGTWTINSSHTDKAVQYQEFRNAVSGGALDKHGLSSTTTSYTHTGLLDGEQYDFRIDTLVRQYRNGTGPNNWWRMGSTLVTETTRSPAPTGLSVSNVTADSADLAWVDNHGNEDGYRTYVRRKDGLTGMDFTGLGSQEYVQADGLSYTGPTFSVAVRFALDALSVDANNNWRNLVGSNTVSNFLLVEENGTTTFRVPAATPGFLQSSNAITADGSIHTAIASYDGATKYNYVDDGPGNSEAVSNSSIDLSGFFTGGNSTNHNPDGRIYEVAIWSKVLTSTERTTWENGDVPAKTELLAYFPLDHNDAGTTYDCSTYHNNGSITGPTLTGPTVSLDSSLAANSSSDSLTSLLNGEEYDTFVEAYTEHGRVRDQ